MPPIEADALGPNIAAVTARGQGGAQGVSAQSDSTAAIMAVSGNGAGIHAVSGSAPGVEAESTSGPGARISSQQATGMLSFVGSAQVGLEAALLEHAGHAIAAITNLKDAAGVMATGSSYGVHASSPNGIGVYAHSDTGIALQVDGYLHIQGPAVGKVMALRGESSWQVQSTAVTPQSIILLTPLGDPGARLWIDPPAAGMFTIHASQALPGGLTIQYLIIN